MTIQTAAGIIQRLGPCRIALDRSAHAVLVRELALLGCDPVDIADDEGCTRPGRTIGFLEWTHFDTGDALAEALRRFATMDALVLQSGGQPRHGVEETLFEAGWQRHAGGLMHGDYSAWSTHALPEISYYERSSPRVVDGLLRGGAEADGAIARYAMAASHARPGDHVLIDSPHAAEGAAILSALSRAATIVTTGENVADHSVDLIVALEPEGDWVARLNDYARLLRYDGRLILGWPHTAGGNSYPHDWEALVEAASEFFLPETRYVHGPIGRGFHALHSIPLEDSSDTDWMILVASANPLAGEGLGAGFDHPAFPKADGPWPALADFGGAYDNPWLYRSMVQMGERIGHDLKLARLAECVIEDSRPDSADRGAALAVLGYRVLELRLPNLVEPLLPLIAAYVELSQDDATSAHIGRWGISLAFLAGRLCELTGDRDAAKRWYRKAAEADWEGFSPLLTTKTIAASFFEARLLLADGDSEAAHARFRHGFDTALKAAAFPHETQTGPAGRPLGFYLQELAEVIDMGSQCANALAHFHLWERDPGLFWRQVDIRRFGLASWARDLERENSRLRAA